MYTLRYHTSSNFGRNKGRTVQTSDLKTSDWNKRQTGTNVRLVQTSDWDKRRISTNVRPVQTSDGYIKKKERWTMVELKKILYCKKKY